jgi:hypothetical protein
VPPSRSSLPRSEPCYPPLTLDMWYMSSQDTSLMWSEPVYCVCTSLCCIRGTPLCNNFLERRECGAHCNSEDCHNRRLGDPISHLRLTLKQTADRGLGVFTHYTDGLSPYKKDDIVGEFRGHCTTSLTRVPSYHCVVELVANAVYLVCSDQPSDPTRKIQYANHSCDPNCEIQIWTDGNGWPRALVIARYDLLEGVEVTVDYNMIAQHSTNTTNLPCLCGTTKCRRFLASCRTSQPSRESSAVSPPIVVSAIPTDV